jgi:hypothetical protein
VMGETPDAEIECKEPVRQPAAQLRSTPSTTATGEDTKNVRVDAGTHRGVRARESDEDNGTAVKRANAFDQKRAGDNRHSLDHASERRPGL